MLAAVPPGFDLNSASLDELEALAGLTPEQATVLYRHIQDTGGLESIYEVIELDMFTPEDLLWLRENTIVLPPGEDHITQGP